MKKSYRLYLMAVLALTATGCTTQFRNDAENVRATLGDLYVDQTLDNLGRFIEDPQGTPSLSNLTPGTVEADTALTPSVTVPFGNQVATTVVGTAGETITAPSRSFTLGGSLTSKIMLGVAPISDPMRLRNSAAVYRYVLDPSSIRLKAVGDQSRPLGPEDKLRQAYAVPVQIGDKGVLTVDKLALLHPQCVVCLSHPETEKAKQVDAAVIKDATKTEINSSLGQGGWLHSELNPERHWLGYHKGHTLSMSNLDYQKGSLRELVLLLMQPPPTPAPDLTHPLISVWHKRIGRP